MDLCLLRAELIRFLPSNLSLVIELSQYGAGSEAQASQLCKTRVENQLSQVPGKRLYSISHSLGKARLQEGVILAVGIIFDSGSGSGVGGLGVDLEFMDRSVTSHLLDRISTLEERNLAQLDALSFWVLKEACFKANPTNAGTWLSLYRLVAFDSGAGVAELQTENWSYRAKLFNAGRCRIAVAYSYRV